ncbi:5585_t:CDS:2 [Paraglomus occultum]|uniref:5585_t:CDS:1 n=1 Tax=Paraglomus occultum TaxID=144539 RepID=A0A9N8ZRI2_9GLOM|nr:5585_t:CDS:2 [Paraglomus occultum]
MPSSSTQHTPSPSHPTQDPFTSPGGSSSPGCNLGRIVTVPLAALGGFAIEIGKKEKDSVDVLDDVQKRTIGDIS